MDTFYVKANLFYYSHQHIQTLPLSPQQKYFGRVSQKITLNIIVLL